MTALLLDYNQINNAFKTVLARVATASEAQTYAGLGSVEAVQVALYATQAYQAEVVPVAKLYGAILGRLPDASGLNYWVNTLREGKLTLDGVIAEFLQSAEAQANFGKAFGLPDYQEQILPVARLYTALLGRAPDAAGLSFWVNALHNGQITLQGIAAEFLVSAEAQTKFDYLGGDNTAFVRKLYVTALGREGDTEGVASKVALLDGGFDRGAMVLVFSESFELSTRPATTQYAAFDAAAATMRGTLADGYTKGATVFADANGNRVWDEGEAKTSTAGDGSFLLTDAQGTLIASGGTDITSNLARITMHKAIGGATVINPLATLQHALVQLGQSPAQSQQTIAKAFGISVDIAQFDALAVAMQSDATSAARAAAVQVHVLGVKLENLVTTAARLLTGAAGSSLAPDAAAEAVVASISRAIADDSDGIVNLNDPSLIKSVLNGAVAANANPALQAIAPAVAGMADNFAVVLADAGQNLDEAAGISTDVYTVLAHIGKVATAVQGSVAGVLEQAASTGSLGGTIGGVTGASLDTLIRKALIVDINANSNADQPAIDAANALAIDPVPTPAPTPTPTDVSAPTLASSTPSDNATAIAVGSNIVLTFSETVTAGTGNIVITNINDASDTRTIGITDATQVTISGDTVTINPTANLNPDTSYHVQMASGVITDLAGNAYAGIGNAATLNFSTPDTIMPTLASSTPSDNATAVAVGSNIVLTFSETVTAGTGNIVITNINDAADTRTIGITDATQVVIAGNVVTINPDADLLSNASYHIQIAAGAIKDTSGNSYAGIANPTTLNFTTPVAVVALSSLNGASGFRLDGMAAGDYSGHSVSTAGDVNGDGFDDLIVGANQADPQGASSGSSYVVFGQASGFAANMDLSTLNGINGFRLDGAVADDNSGWSVSTAGDVNGDGLADLIVSAHLADPNGNDSGSSYVLFGKTGGFSASVGLSTVNGTTGFRLDGAAIYDFSSFSVSNAGDINGDGFGDLLVGAKYADPHGSAAGSSYVVYGKSGGFAATVNLSSLNGVTGFRLDGVSTYDWSGTSVSMAGDVNGDGFADLIIGAKYADPNGNASGAAYVVFGKSGGFPSRLELSNLNGATGFRLAGAAATDNAGVSVSAAGDVNGDGFADLIVGAHLADPNGSNSGASYVVFGKASGFTPNVNLSTLNGANGFRIAGVAAADISGFSVSNAGDVNGDGFDDLLIGAMVADPNGTSSGSSYVVYGKAAGFGATMNLSDLDGSNGFRLDGVAAFDLSGGAVSTAGDVNGDGFADLIVGAEYADPHGSSSGSSYVIFGGNLTGAVSFLGSGGNDVLTGTAVAERFVAGTGNDTLTGGGGADVFYGGAGDDIIAVSDIGFARADGGAGIDALVLVGTGLHVNLGQLRNRIDGIEKIDITGSGNNTLTLTAVDLRNLSDSSNTLTVDGNTGDIIDIGAGWVHSGNAGGYHTYLQGTATLRLATAVAITDAPTLVSSSPADDAEAVGISSNIVLTFSEAVQAGTGNIVITNINNAGDTRTIAIGDATQVVIAGNVVTINPAANLLFNASYHVQISAGAVTDATGVPFAGIVDTTTLNFMTPVTTQVELSNLNGINGFRLDGAAAYDRSGASVSSAGDINGDGFADLIIGAVLADSNGADSGSSYIVFGKASGFAASADLSSLDGTNGFRLAGAAAGDRAGYSVGAAGDVNGDGFADLIVGAPTADSNGSDSGASYVIFGKASGFAASINLSSLNGTTGFRLAGVAASDLAGVSVSTAGDVNGDGFADLIIGARQSDPNGSNSGSSYIVFGKTSGFASTINLSSLDGTNGFRLAGAAAGDRAGYSVGAAGDVNGDGFADLIVGAPYADSNGSNSGAGYVIFGKASGFAASINLSSLNGTTGFRLTGVAAGNYSGYSVSTAGDVNGDGFADLVVGANQADPNGSNSGSTYIVFGKASGFASTINLSTLNGSTGFRIDGAAAGDEAGYMVSQAGDVNGDGYDDMLVGARDADPHGASAGSSYVIYGKASGFAASINLASLDGMTGFRLDGAAGEDRSGSALRAAGDVNGDGFADLIIGSFSADPHGSESGSSHIVFGGDFTAAVTFLGSGGNDVLTGTAAAERFVAGTGNDTLTGGGGADVFYGGAGDDIIAVSDIGFARADGGSGSDTLKLTGPGATLDLGLFRNRISGIEIIDLTNAGNYTLGITARDLLNVSDTSNTLIVDLNNTDTVTFADAGWTDVGLVGGYHKYTNGQAILLMSI